MIEKPAMWPAPVPVELSFRPVILPLRFLAEIPANNPPGPLIAMKIPVLLLLVLGLVAPLRAAPVPLKYTRIDLSDGRSLMNVVVKSYDPATDKLLVTADGKAVLFPIKLVPQPFRDRLKKEAPQAGSTNSIVPGQKPPDSAPPAKKQSVAEKPGVI